MNIELTAVCAIGHYRTFASTAQSIVRNVLHSPNLVFFGVAADDWKDVDSYMSFANVVEQAPCPIRVPSQFAPRESAASYQQELCDLNRCEELISNFEQVKGFTFSSSMLLRLDLFWESRVAMPWPIMQNDLHVPKWNNCGGICDKFAVGGRSAMRLLFTRGYHSFNRNPRYSEHFLANVIRQHENVTVYNHNDWVFCKLKRKGWEECTRRIQRNQMCKDGFRCPSCGR